MSLKYYRTTNQTYCCLILLPLVFIFLLFLIARLSNDLEVAEIPSIDEYHIQQASDLLKQSGSRNDTHVVVIGAGAAGLSAAYTLEYLGLPYTILEASGTFGGRVQEMADFIDVPLDLGAEWIHVQPRVLQDMLLFEGDDASTIDLIEYFPQSISVYTRGKNRRRNWFSNFNGVEYKFANTTWWSYFANYFYPHVADHLEFNAAVNHIQYDDPNSGNDGGQRPMSVTTTDGRTYTASHVILTAPIRMLQDREIVFSPDLDARTWNVVDDVVMADGMKVWMEWDHDFNPDAQLTTSILKGIEVQPLYFDAVLGKTATDANVLCLFTVNTKEASQRASWSDEEIVQQAVDKLEDIFDRNLREHLLQSRVQNWSREPYVRGAYTWNYGEYDEKELGKPLYQGHLFLAGEHLGGGQAAMVQGAVISGRQAVLKLLDTTTFG